jgi:IS30 family transposase
VLITQYAAAKQAGVSKQSINKQLNKVPKPIYFIELKEGWKIDDDHQLWKSYCQSVAIRKGKIGQQEKRFNDLLKAVVEVIQERFSPSSDDMSEILKDISDRSGL